MRKVAIVARSATAGLAPFFNPHWEIWGMPWVTYPRVDLNFDVHSQECWDKNDMPVAEQKQWEAAANELTAPVLCHPSRLHLFERGEVFPFEEVEDLSPFGFLENTIAYQLAYALWQHQCEPIGEVAIYGANMMGRREYQWERASVLYWTGILQGTGIKITVPDGAALFMSYWMQGKYGKTAEKRFAL